MKSNSTKLTAPSLPMVKFILLGSCGVGKTAIMNRFCDGRFTQNTAATVGVDFKYRDLTVDGEDVRLHVWDTAGQEQFRVISKPYYRQADGIILVYDCTAPHTIDDLDYYVSEARDMCQLGVAIVLLGNKVDLVHNVSSSGGKYVKTKEGEAFAMKRGIPIFFETSAANGQCIDEAFELLTQYSLNNKRVNSDLNGRGSRNIKRSNVRLQPKFQNAEIVKECKC